jgi:tRNA nucleotidyltransferase (CCA-adding enzyme)
MLLILTHENSDFDAVASQLAAHKLYPEGVPLLSRRVNRNVSQFLALYWDALPFMRPDDWQRQRVEQVILVDTQSLPSVRGVRSEKTAVQVIDHHEAAEEGYPDTWNCRIDPIGATTTLLVEELEEGGNTLTAIEATLLLLGIHEDTGSLTYDTTTVRDVRAAAWLVEQGAQLSIVRHFLDIPLSDSQRKLYDQLQAAADWLTVEGQTILLSAVTAAPDFEDEISAVAHRLRDALSPDGMVLLVALRQHVQLVARSSNDDLDVAELAQAFGGGGHGRAAAATILDRSLKQVEARVRLLLPQIVRPAVRVAQIMSYGVQTLAATATVGEAAERMSRFGHEGYPIVDADSDQLVGLLTRRAVDRAMSHQLERLPVSQVMKVGQVTVRPSDSIEQVQRLMMEEGWGQIPVVADEAAPAGADGDAGRLIGIVTRTDLLNRLAEPLTRPLGLTGVPDGRQLLAEGLSPALWAMVQVVSEVTDELSMPVYFVGGLVRDLLLGKSSVDLDMVVEGDAITLVRRLRARYGGDARSHDRFGTAKWMVTPAIWRLVAPDAALDNVPATIDFVTARTEFYTRPTALPEVERGSIKLDLHRRDFTINTLAIRLDGAHLGELLDFYGGRRDLEQGLIRILHSLSFIDDPTRILRAVRLEQRLGFTIEAHTAGLLTAALPLLDRVTGDRIRHEMELALREENPIPVMERLAQSGVMAQLHPGLLWQLVMAEAFGRVPPLLNDPLWRETLQGESPAFVYFSLWLTPLSPTVQDEVMTRLRVRKTTRDDLGGLLQLLHDLATLPADARPSQWTRVLRPHPGRVLLAALAVLGPEAPASAAIQNYWRSWRLVRPVINGNDLLAMGIKPGPEIGRLLDRLLTARLDGEVVDEAAERALLNKTINEGIGR